MRTDFTSILNILNFVLFKIFLFCGILYHCTKYGSSSNGSNDILHTLMKAETPRSKINIESVGIRNSNESFTSHVDG